MAAKKISIIIPVYNVEKYLRECLDSLCAQTMIEDIEIIAVNDGSTDSSPAILREYEANYPKLFTIFDVKNQGVSHARNFGVTKAKGEYVLFVDSDDYIEHNMCELLYNKAVQADSDVVLCRYYNAKENPDTHEIVREVGKSYLVKYDDNFTIQDRNYQLVHISPFPWDKLYRRSLVARFPFPVGLRFEDLSVMYQMMSAAGKISVVNKALYNYRRTSATSFLNTLSEQTLDLIPSLRLMINAMKEQGKFESLHDEIEYICIRHVFVRFNSMFDVATVEKKRGQKELKQRIVNECLDFLEKYFLDWRENRYLKYTSSPNNRKMRHLYADKEKTLKRLNFYESSPLWVLRLYFKGKKFRLKFKRFIKSKPLVRLWNKIKSGVKKIKGKIITGYKNLKKKILNSAPYKLINPPRDVRYMRMVQKYPVVDKDVFFLSKHGEDVAGNVFYMLKAMQREEYRQFTIYIALIDKIAESWRARFERYGITNVKIIRYNSKDYIRCLATSKYLITDTSFATFFLKREGQVYLNTWHGTPLKMMGRSVPNREYALGNIQRNFFQADYLLYQNAFSRDVFLDDYMIREIYNGKVLMSGYPRNSAFFDTHRYDEIRKELGLEDKQVMVYMPTWRGLLTNKENKKQIENLMKYFRRIDAGLNDNQVLYVKLHPFVKSGIRYKRFKHIHPFPSDYETYDFLNASNLLITDYSSIMFDYAASKKKIILFTYDRKKYLKERGMYIDLESVELPFADKVSELLALINDETPAQYPEFWKEYCSLDSATSAEDVCDYMFLGKTPKFEVQTIKHNGKKNVLMMSKGLPEGKAARRRVSALNEYNMENINYYYCMKSEGIRKSGKALSKLDRRFFYMPLMFDVNYTVRSRVACALAFRFNLRTKWLERQVDKLAAAEAEKYFGGADFDLVVNVNSRDRILHLACAKLKGIKVYNWVAFDIEEYKNNKVYYKLTNYLLHHMQGYDYLMVNEDLKKLWESLKKRPDIKLIEVTEEGPKVSEVVEKLLAGEPV